MLAQVQLSRLLGVKKGNNYQPWPNRVKRMSTDFVVCNKNSSVVAIIELDDSSHKKADRQVADAEKGKALDSADVRILRWQVGALPHIAAIQTLLLPIQN
jgi:very-short-patch-repair endonuclease